MAVNCLVWITAPYHADSIRNSHAFRRAFADVSIGKEAGDAFMEQGKTLERGGEKDEAANAYINASKAYKKTHPKGTQTF